MTVQRSYSLFTPKFCTAFQLFIAACDTLSTVISMTFLIQHSSTIHTMIALKKAVCDPGHWGHKTSSFVKYIEQTLYFKIL